jgi:hypothetical protein
MTQVAIHRFPVVGEPHLTTVRDKTRNSGLTSVCFVDDDTLLCADFNDKRLYLASIAGGRLDILQTHPTLIADGTPVQTDLMDYRDGRIVVSNFYQGSISLYRLNGTTIAFERELNLNDYKGLHGVRFIPGAPDLVWLTYCGNRNKCHQIVDLMTDTVLHQIETDQQCQDVAFVGGHAVVFARTDHIFVGTTKARLFSRKWWMFATAYVYRMPEDIRGEPPAFVSRWKGKGHIDAVKAHDGRIYAANQYLDRVDVFTLSATGQLSLDRTIDGLKMPHGLDVRGKRLAVTNYADQTLRVMALA